jgi:hypothetical protein
LHLSKTAFVAACLNADLRRNVDRPIEKVGDQMIFPAARAASPHAVVVWQSEALVYRSHRTWQRGRWRDASSRIGSLHCLNEFGWRFEATFWF